MAWGHGGYGGYGGCCGFTCESQCPPQHVWIQPAAFCVTVPGPIMDCYTDPLETCCSTPCCNYGCGGCGGWGRGGYGGGWGGRW